jgi:hypothetical protein
VSTHRLLVLLVEHDEATAAFLRAALADEGHSPVRVPDQRGAGRGPASPRRCVVRHPFAAAGGFTLRSAG